VTVDKKPSIARKVHKRLFIECTYTYLYGGNTGIQRVVRNIVNNCRGVGRKMGVRGQPVVWTADSFITVRDVDVKGRHFYTARMWLKDLARSLARFMPPMYIFRFLRSSRLVVELRAVAGKILKIVGKPVLRYVSRMRHKKVDFEEGDILLLLDSSWHTPFWEGVRQARERGVRVGVVIYDLIPLRFAHTCDQCLVRIFQEWLLKAFSCTDFFLAISNAVRDDLKAYMREGWFIPAWRRLGWSKEIFPEKKAHSGYTETTGDTETLFDGVHNRAKKES
jgi:alpha-1,2-rhamnosyltransferase